MISIFAIYASPMIALLNSSLLPEGLGLSFVRVESTQMDDARDSFQQRVGATGGAVLRARH